uniref:Rab5-interacting protein n=1 Tax=Chromera velia CCMP2878 TaxID=1169474 RepID=A0A0G4GAG2_9ALVE|mmetsp:Transcript_37802/g.74336  ORF Transcript_37802/g.74336 Transcript_37802/m.74336 type:complete len:111 (+) Transcript_37802:383-715(+)|eukprot:Cvel_20991.t1-p1 / transcript=Cvel_20991.t1 / gene=Cvel_20991 / organism=Chromera_velia_CCMP2878 / gene_product=hypothetical protein / transcript_product=hypothetical protein / location=Cvel_scaffold1932:32377-34432(-) / protein_length=110 / sequence_SO=supercontig / SO=protein_coding / is_pseudo=false
MTSKGDLFKRAFDFRDDAEEFTKADFLELLHWIRHALAAAIGICSGIFGVTGWAPFITLGAVMVFGIINYSQRLRLSDEIEITPVVMEGINPAMLTFLFFWILVYTFLHG